MQPHLLAALLALRAVAAPHATGEQPNANRVWAANAIEVKGKDDKINKATLELEQFKQRAFDSMVAVRNARMEAAVESWKPAEGFEVVKIFDDLGEANINIKEIASKSGKKKTELVELFRKHIKGAHQENIKYLQDSVATVCSKGGTVSRKRELSCGSNTFSENWGGDIEGVSNPSVGGEVSKLKQ
ncbi:hypothetical protein BM221_010808 [Beauveria bassiana]|uniref:Uncharacterized protein n=1 Tax=Beauveria bassiana TaxID=176275 RepID=A0A2N6N7U4_BEABA|nr:hypothetical protein BM221_010808 [Beauveria bassiana]